MSGSVQAGHSPSYHQFCTIHPHNNNSNNTSQYQESGKMTPVPNSDDRLIDVDPLRQPPVTTSRQVSLSEKMADAKAAMITPPSRLIPSSLESVPLSSSSTRSILVPSMPSSNVKSTTDDDVRQTASTSTVSSSTEMTNATTGTKRKMSLNAETNFSPTTGSPQSNTPMSRRDSLPMLLRNKKMKATDCLLFAATLLEQDAAEALVAAGTTPRTTTDNNNTNTNRSSPPNGSLLATSHVTTSSFVAPTVPSPPPKKKTKPLKKMVCEKIERSLQKIALERKKQLVQELDQEQQEEQQEDDEDCENKPKDADVLCGRGGKVNKHPGNIVYRKVVEYNKSYYQSVHKKHRILVSQSIVKAILNYGGRFMGQKGKEWTPIGFKRAVQKTSQALRERSNTSDVVTLRERSNTSDVVMQGVVSTGEYNILRK